MSVNKKKTKEEILLELYDTMFVPNYIKKLANSSDQPFLEDLENDIWVILYSQPEERIQNLYYSQKRNQINAVRRFTAGCIHRSIRSTTSPYYRLYKKMNSMMDKNYEKSLAEKEQLGLMTDDWYSEADDQENKVYNSIEL